MNTPDPEPQGGHSKTTIKVFNSAGVPWEGITLTHNGATYVLAGKSGVSLKINGGAVRIYGIDVTKQVQKGVENIFRYDNWTGSLKRTKD